MNKRSILAVVAGLLFVLVVTTLVDIVFHALGVFPPTKQPLDHAQSAIATFYRIILGVAGAWLTARLAPARPMKHALVLGWIGTGLAALGLAVTWNLGLGPRWYPILLLMLALPQCWLGGKIREWTAG